MNVYTAERTDTTITLGFRDENPTIIMPMIRALNDDKSVVLVRYIDQHPDLSDVMLFIKVKTGRPEDAVERASKAVSAYFAPIEQ